MNRCSRPDLSGLLEAYCVGDGETRSYAALEAHLLECSVCWAEFQRLEAAVRLLREERHDAIGAADVIQFHGLTGRFEEWLAGHGAASLLIGAALGVLAALALLVEVAYAWPSLGTWATRISLLLVASGAGAYVAAAALIVHCFRRGRTYSLSAGLVLLVAWLAIAGALVAHQLPSVPVVRANFQTWVSYMGWLKNLLQASIVPAAALVALHGITGLQREMTMGRVRNVVALLAREPHAVRPRGLILVTPTAMLVVLAIIAMWLAGGTIRLLEGLQVSPFMPLFTWFAAMRLAGYLVAGACVTLWYGRQLNDLKREALAVSALHTSSTVH